MNTIRPWGHIFWIGITCIVLFGGACASAEQSVDQDKKRATEPEAVSELGLLSTDDDIRTIQIYGIRDETAIPVYHLGSSEEITVAFDLMSAVGRPLSTYFYHADRMWKRDLTPAEYLSSFHRDDLLDYQSSTVTDVEYIHYRYRFPNRSINFRISGNYILRVTEQGMEDEVLFEKPFFVSEQATNLDVQLDQVLIAGRGYSSVQPQVRFSPVSTLSNPYDYAVCFVRNDRYSSARCNSRPELSGQPSLGFYLEPEDSFEPVPAAYFLDLSEIRVGGRIEFTDLSVEPPEAALSPDYARFPGTGLAPFLNGQTVIDKVVQNVADPSISAEYARVFFRFVPLNEQKAHGRIAVTGSFNGWEYDSKYELTWIPDRGLYEGTVLLKQGQYEYRYIADDPAIRRAMANGPPQFQNLYTTFVYLRDVSLSTDRLLALSGILIQ